MGWIKSILERQRERDKLFKNIVVNGQALEGLIKIPPARDYGLETLDEEVRSVYRDFIEDVSKVRAVGSAQNRVEQLLYGKRIETILSAVNLLDKGVYQRIYGPEHVPQS